MYGILLASGSQGKYREETYWFSLFGMLIHDLILLVSLSYGYKSELIVASIWACRIMIITRQNAWQARRFNYQKLFLMRGGLYPPVDVQKADDDNDKYTIFIYH